MNWMKCDRTVTANAFNRTYALSLYAVQPWMRALFPSFPLPFIFRFDYLLACKLCILNKAFAMKLAHLNISHKSIHSVIRRKHKQSEKRTNNEKLIFGCDAVICAAIVQIVDKLYACACVCVCVPVYLISISIVSKPLAFGNISQQPEYQFLVRPKMTGMRTG